MLRRTITLLVLPVTALAVTTVPASADTERLGRCGGGSYELSVDPEDGGYEVGVDLDRVTPGSRWTISVRHEGTRYAKVTRTADREGDLDLETVRAGTAGEETFAFTAKRVGGQQKCGARVTVR